MDLVINSYICLSRALTDCYLALLCCYFLTLLCVRLPSFLSDFPQSYQNLLPNCCIDLLPRPVNEANQLGNFMLCCLLPFFQINFFKKSFQEHYQNAILLDKDQNRGSVGSGPRGYKTFSMLNSAEHDIYPAHKC